MEPYTGKLKIKTVERHRNGVAGSPFDIVTFDERNGRKWDRKVAILFADKWNIAVLNVDLLAAENVKFGENSWRGDNYENEMRQAVKEHWDKLLGPEDGA
jgi:hypothetical protein